MKRRVVTYAWELLRSNFTCSWIPVNTTYRAVEICANTHRGSPENRYYIGPISVHQAQWYSALCVRRGWLWFAIHTFHRTPVRVQANNRKYQCFLVTSSRILKYNIPMSRLSIIRFIQQPCVIPENVSIIGDSKRKTWNVSKILLKQNIYARMYRI